MDAKTIIYPLYFYFPPNIKLLHLIFTVLDGGYESDDESIWSEKDEQTTDIYNYGEYLLFILAVKYTIDSIKNCLMKCLKKLSILCVGCNS